MQLFLKKFYGFSPSTVPVITFSQIGSRDSLLKRAKYGDRIVYVAAKSDEHVSKEEQGKILGMAEIGRDKVRTLDMISDLSVVDKKYFLPNGDFLWPEGIPMLRAWRFILPVDRLDVLDKTIADSQATRQNAILLSEEAKAKIFSLPMEEVKLPPTSTLDKQRAFAKAMQPEFREKWGKDVSRIADTIRNTVANANGQEVSRTVKEKNMSFRTDGDLQSFLLKKIEEQNGCCAITGQPLLPHQPESWFAPSADRIDSEGHYAPDNIQIVSKAANRAKSDIAADKVQDFFDALQFYDPSIVFD